MGRRQDAIRAALDQEQGIYRADGERASAAAEEVAASRARLPRALAEWAEASKTDAP